ncbi:MAG: 4'-phosphopantetheinyl transferase family protein [Lysobacterales bacterium]
MLDATVRSAKHAAMPGNSAVAVFAPRASAPPLGQGEIHVWFFTHTDSGARATAGAARMVLARLLCRYADLDAPPAIERGAHGKPFAPGLPDIEFNLSHAGAQVLLAFARGQALGIDLERIDRRLSLDGIAKRFFAEPEARALQRLPEHARLRAFLRLWTHKEAVLKALGVGIGFGLERIEFELDPDGEIASLLRIAAQAGEPERWQLHRLDPAPGLFGALAWHGPPRLLRTFTLLP